MAVYDLVDTACVELVEARLVAGVNNNFFALIKTPTGVHSPREMVSPNFG